MAGEVKKITCRICGTEHKAGEPCPECEWDEVKESRRAKGEAEREKLRDEAKKGEGRRGNRGFWD